MTSDTALSAQFYRDIFKKQVKKTDTVSTIVKVDRKIKVAGVIKSDPKTSTGIANLNVELYKDGQLVSSSKTNRNGVFLMKNIIWQNGYELKVKKNSSYRTLWLDGEEGSSVGEGILKNNDYVWSLDSSKLFKIWNEYFTYCIGGKLIQTTNTKKEFFSDKTVWLLNKNYTAIKKVKTNVFSAFVF